MLFFCQKFIMIVSLKNLFFSKFSSNASWIASWNQRFSLRPRDSWCLASTQCKGAEVLYEMREHMIMQPQMRQNMRSFSWTQTCLTKCASTSSGGSTCANRLCRATFTSAEVARFIMPMKMKDHWWIVNTFIKNHSLQDENIRLYHLYATWLLIELNR